MRGLSSVENDVLAWLWGVMGLLNATEACGLVLYGSVGTGCKATVSCVLGRENEGSGSEWVQWLMEAET